MFDAVVHAIILHYWPLFAALGALEGYLWYLGAKRRRRRG